jgi:acetamidase/formamidase
MGIDEDLDEAARQALREMIMHITRQSELTRDEAYMLCSLVGNMRVSQLVNGNKGIHMMMAKSAIR